MPHHRVSADCLALWLALVQLALWMLLWLGVTCGGWLGVLLGRLVDLFEGKLLIIGLLDDLGSLSPLRLLLLWDH